MTALAVIVAWVVACALIARMLRGPVNDNLIRAVLSAGVLFIGGALVWRWG